MRAPLFVLTATLVACGGFECPTPVDGSHRWVGSSLMGGAYEQAGTFGGNMVNQWTGAADPICAGPVEATFQLVLNRSSHPVCSSLELEFDGGFVEGDTTTPVTFEQDEEDDRLWLAEASFTPTPNAEDDKLAAYAVRTRVMLEPTEDNERDGECLLDRVVSVEMFTSYSPAPE